MLTALGDCPNCHEPDLYRAPGRGLCCAECGWREEVNVSETRVEYTLNDILQKCDMIEAQFVTIPRRELEQEHTHLLGRVQQLRRLLGLPPLPTGKELRRAQAERR